MIKLIATDIDGTLLHSDQTQPAELPQIQKKLKEKNIIFAVASGRPYLTLQNTFPHENKDLLYIAENGAYVVYKDKELSVHTLDYHMIEKLITITRRIPNAYVVLCTPEGAYVESDHPDFLKELEKYYVKYTIVPDITQVQSKFVKFTVCDLAGAEYNSYPHFKELKDQIQISVAGSVWLDMMTKGVNKGEAIKEIQASLNITDKETMVFGDYLNDLEMMKSAYYSYAVENAHPDLIQAARFKTASNDEDGVILKINEMLNNNRNPIDE